MIKKIGYLMALTILLSACSSEENDQVESPFSPEVDGFDLEVEVINDTENEDDLGELTFDIYPSPEDWENKTNKVFTTTVTEGTQEFFITTLMLGGNYEMDVYSADGEYDNGGLTGNVRFLPGSFFTEKPSGKVMVRIENSRRKYVGTYTFANFVDANDTAIDTTPALIPQSMTINTDYSITFVDRNQATGTVVSHTVPLRFDLTYFTELENRAVTIMPQPSGALQIARAGNTLVEYTPETP